ncbi:4-(cytidine 5'-diphospho)-2-C-methyl-D-erythritol kinase [Amaricoccus tamworthensis]|uniref:4-(cytidine 5'-diphospho)-2-C-methyl-D-erythritol kinase n=1 Tax=Amaricoccus tamworthensis TaxID=57002 RepID=UPI003C79A09D
MSAIEFAPAKVNLTLHVTGRRADGYHLLDSLVVFPQTGDSVSATPASEPALTITGPFAEGLETGPDNLVLRAAALCDAPPHALTLTKNLPVASGIGGGSADAAATLRLLTRLTGTALPDRTKILDLGADIPVCLDGRSCRMSGIGEVIDPVTLPEFHLVLVNPRVAVMTGAVFQGLRSRDNPSMSDPPEFTDLNTFVEFLRTCRNELEHPAIAVQPVIADVIAALADTTGCRLARMSGSGATCYGVFKTAAESESAVSSLRSTHPNWWVSTGRVA